MTKKIRWFRCEVPRAEAGDFKGRLVEGLSKPYALAGAPSGVAIVAGMPSTADSVSVWLTERAAQLADQADIKWRCHPVVDDALPPELGKVVMLLGEKSELEELLWGVHGEQ